MDLISLLIGLVAGAVIALAAYIVIRRSILKGKRDEIIEKAEVEAEEPVAEPEGEIADDVDIHNLAAEVERIKGELEHKKEEIAELKDRVAALEGKADNTEETLRNMSAAKPAHEEVKATQKETYTDKHNAFLAKIAEGARK